MSEQRLLRCPACNRVHQVGLSQAGQSFLCRCGSQVEVPPLRLLRELEPVQPEATATSPRKRWEIRQMISLIGILVVLVGVAMGYTFWSTTPRPRPVETMHPAELWNLWQFYQRAGLPRRYVRNDPFVQEMQARRLWLIFAGVIICCGAAVIVLSRFLPAWFAETDEASGEFDEQAQNGAAGEKDSPQEAFEV